MPNGGPDNCANCRFNSGSDLNGFCGLRQVAICNTHWTYCRDFSSAHDASRPIPAAPSGPIFASGGYEAGVGYVRIPWFGRIEPRPNVAVECWVCGRRVPAGIHIQVDNKDFGFCTNRHYVDWWKLHQTDPSVDSSFLNTPEFFWMEDDDE